MLENNQLDRSEKWKSLEMPRKVSKSFSLAHTPLTIRPLFSYLHLSTCNAYYLPICHTCSMFHLKYTWFREVRHQQHQHDFHEGPLLPTSFSLGNSTTLQMLTLPTASNLSLRTRWKLTAQWLVSSSLLRRSFMESSFCSECKNSVEHSTLKCKEALFLLRDQLLC